MKMCGKLRRHRPRNRGWISNLVKFNDYIPPNEALENGEIDANAFQHKPHLDNQVKSRGYHIKAGRQYGPWAHRPVFQEIQAVGDLPGGGHHRGAQ